MKIGSLCSGAGALDLAVEHVLGATTAWHCEIDPAASKVLAHRYPGVPNYGDLTTADWSQVEPVDVIAAGFPCQDVSAAGKRAGLKAGTRTGVFANVMDAVVALRPPIVVLENVLGLLTADGDVWPESVVQLSNEADRWARIVRLIAAKQAKAERRGHRDQAWWHRKKAEAVRATRRHRVAVAEFRRERLRLVPRAIATILRSLAEVGYDARWHCLRASEVGAPHQRERIFILATDAAQQPRGIEHRDDVRARSGARRQPQATGRSGDAADTESDGRYEGWSEPARLLGGSDAALSGDADVSLLPTPQAADGGGGHLTRSGDRGTELLLPGVARAYGNGDLLPTPTSRDHKGHNQRRDETCLTGALLPTPAAADGQRGQDFARANRDGSGGDDLVTLMVKADRDQRWGKYADAIARWEALVGPAPAPTEPNRNGNPRLNPAFSEWMMGWPAGWVTQVPGISRNDQLRIIGNGVVLQCAAAALWWLGIVAESLGVSA